MDNRFTVVVALLVEVNLIEGFDGEGFDYDDVDVWRIYEYNHTQNKTNELFGKEGTMRRRDFWVIFRRMCLSMF